MNHIQQLSDAVIDRIAAGEVVERPASVVKELLENSIDAGSSRIEVILESGGKHLIKVVDDGQGIAPEDLQTAFLRHATSKLASVEDLLHIASMGFRGEALASIGSVAQARIVSRVAGDPSGHCVENRGGDLSPVKPAAAPPGTAVEVRQLFYNVPARLKFLKRDATELTHCVEAVTRVLLAYPDLEIGLNHNGRSVLRCEKNLAQLERIERCFGGELARALIAVDASSGRMRLTGYLGRPEMARKDRRRCYLFINGRYVRDNLVHAAIKRAFKERLPDRLQPVYVLHLSLPPEEVDVNVHPMKLEVRFRDGTSVFAGMLSLVEGALLLREGPGQEPGTGEGSTTPWTVRGAPRFSSGGGGGKGAPRYHSYGTPSGAGARGGERGGAGGAGGAPYGAEAAEGAPAWRDADAEAGTVSPIAGAGSGGREELPEHPMTAPPPVTLRGAGRYLQVHGNYLIFEVAEGVAIVDQHALHERVLFERLKAQYEEGGFLMQKLLMPETMPVERSMVHRRDELCVELARLGIDAEPVGDAELQVSAIPVILKKADPGKLAAEIVEQLLAGKRGEDSYLELLHSMACKAAVRAGDRLEEAELAELVRFMETVEHTSHCPHGRPTTVLMTLKELEEMFKRRGF